jgi:hypothetical protein
VSRLVATAAVTFRIIHVLWDIVLANHALWLNSSLSLARMIRFATVAVVENASVRKDTAPVTINDRLRLNFRWFSLLESFTDLYQSYPFST